MFVVHPPWSQVGSSTLYRWLTGFVAVTYAVVVLAIGSLVQDPWQARWMLIGMFGPMVLAAICACVWLGCNRLDARRGRE